MSPVGRFAALIEGAHTGRELHNIAIEAAAADLTAHDRAVLQWQFYGRARQLWPGVFRSTSKRKASS